jgi:(S)-2-hydroxyglutarate dehydrogenase
MYECDYLIIGAGIIGLSIAKELQITNPSATIIIIEKEKVVGRHASGRNSGVLHSGVYYSPDTIKGKICNQGSKEMLKYCQENNLPHIKFGKTIISKGEDNIELLYNRAIEYGIKAEILDKKQLYDIEPCCSPVVDRSLHLSDTHVIDPLSILNSIRSLFELNGGKIHFSNKVIGVDSCNSTLETDLYKYKYSYCINAAGQYADQVAHMFSVGREYIMIPFKGVYYKLIERPDVFCNGLIYPVPDLDLPFLGIHTLKSLKGDTFIGPTALPVLGRENYSGIKGVENSDLVNVPYYLAMALFKNKQNIRGHTKNEIQNIFKYNLTKSAQHLIRNIKSHDLVKSNKSGIRPQLLNKNTLEMMMDFKIEKKDNTIHVLNSISPAFTSAFPFSRMVIDKLLE